MLPKKTYKKALKVLEFYRKQHEADRKDRPERIPIDWKGSLRNSLLRLLGEERVPGRRDALAEETIAAWVKQGLLVDYHGGVTFPGEPIPSLEDIRTKALSILDRT